MTAPMLTASPCPPWCTNSRSSRAVRKDMCDAGQGDRWHTGEFGGVLLPSKADDYYDQEIGVELFRYDNANGSLEQLSVLLAYSTELREIGHIALDIAVARRLVGFIRSHCLTEKWSQKRQFEDPDSTISVQRSYRLRKTQVVMQVENREVRLSLNCRQLSDLADMIAFACLRAESAQSNLLSEGLAA